MSAVTDVHSSFKMSSSAPYFRALPTHVNGSHKILMQVKFQNVLNHCLEKLEEIMYSRLHQMKRDEDVV